MYESRRVRVRTEQSCLSPNGKDCDNTPRGRPGAGAAELDESLHRAFVCYVRRR